MIELARYIPFGQSIGNTSLIARLDPRVKLSCAVLLIACISYINHFVALAICFVFCLILQHYSKVAIFGILQNLRPFMIFLLVTFILQVLFYIPPQGTPQLWQWGLLHFSWAGVLLSIITLVRILFLYYVIDMLTATTSLVDLTDGVDALCRPLRAIGFPTDALVLVLMLTFKFVPIFIFEIERLMKAQAARGMRFGQGNLFQRVLKLAALMIPLFVGGFKRVKTLSVALEARCFGSRPGWQRSRYRQLKVGRADRVILLFTIALAITLVLINITLP